MDEKQIKRRLAAILATDAVGYSKHMARDEEGTLRVLSGHRVIIDGLITTFSGRIVGTAGDSVLAEFGSSVDAVRCAVEIQAALATRNDSLPEPDRLLFRIGINLGDVIVEGDDILGDGVNVAARLESIAEPGGICVSSSIYDQITGKLNLGFADMGQQSLKNIGRPVRTYMVSRDGAAPAPGFELSPTSLPAAPVAPAAKSGATLWLAAAGAVGLVIVAVMLLGGRQQPVSSVSEAASAAPVSGPASASGSSPAVAQNERAPIIADAQPRPMQATPAAPALSSTAGAPAPTAAAAPMTSANVTSAPVAATPSSPVSVAPKVFTGGTATGACEGDEQLTGQGMVRVEGKDVIVSFPPAAGRRAPVVARGQLRDDGGLTLQVVRGGRGRGAAGGSFSGQLVDGRGTLTGPAGRCTVGLQLN